MPCTLLLGYRLVPRYSESLAVLHKFLNLGGRQKKFRPPKLCAKFPPMHSGPKFAHKKSYGENPESLSHLGMNRYRVMTDRQTDWQNYDS